MASWRCGRASDLPSRGRGFESRSGTRRKNLGQVSHTYVPLSPSNYWPKGGDARRLGRYNWRKVMAAYRRVHDHACYHLQGDCLELGISSGPIRSKMSMGTYGASTPSVFAQTAPSKPIVPLSYVFQRNPHPHGPGTLNVARIHRVYRNRFSEPCVR